MEAVPGVRSAGWASTLPLGGSQLGGQSFEIIGDPPARDGNKSSADFQIVSHTYFRTLDLPIVAGRAFTAEDRADALARVHRQRRVRQALPRRAGIRSGSGCG